MRMIINKGDVKNMALSNWATVAWNENGDP